jgi:DNA mismatch endonuclease (patch repair protein)
MQKQRTRDTGPEKALRRELHALGLRYFVHRRPVPGLRREADVLFPTQRVAVFCDGCFWHGCPDHCVLPLVNQWYWEAKIEGNRGRDLDTALRLAEAGWEAVRVWEHEDPGKAARRVARVVRKRTDA